MGGAAGAAGLVIGGLLTQILGWRSVFLINLPVGILITVGAVATITSHQRTHETATQRVNLAGALGLIATLGLLVFGLSLAGDHGITHWSVAVTLAGAVLAGLIFAVAERRTAAPVLPTRIFSIAGTTPSYLMAFVLNAVIASSLFFTTLFMQNTLGYGPLATGLGFLPNSGLVVIGAFLAGKLAQHWNPRTVLYLGGGSITIGTGLLATITLTPGYLFPVLPGFALIGLGLGFSFTAFTIAATANVPAGDQGTASGILNTAQQVGFAIGIAAIVAAAQMPADPITGYSLGYLIDAATVLLAITFAAPLYRRARQSWTRLTDQ